MNVHLTQSQIMEIGGPEVYIIVSGELSNEKLGLPSVCESVML